MTTEIMDTLLALKCGTCWGEKQILCHAASDGDCNWDKCPQGWDINAHCRLDIQDDEEADIPPCPDCQHPATKQPTGLLIPGLVRECRKCYGKGVYFDPSDGTGKAEPCRMLNCFKGFVPVSEDTALRVALEWLAETWCMNISCMDGTWFVILEVGDQCQVPTMGTTPLEALAAAIKASVEANHDN